MGNVISVAFLIILIFQVENTKRRNDFILVIASQMNILVAMCLFYHEGYVLCCE